jgi:hypothetical protein
MEQLAYISLPHDNCGIVFDVSEGGLGSHLVAPVEKGEQIRFRLSVRSVAGIDALDEVVWKDETGKSGGLRFTHLPDEVNELVRIWSGHPDLTLAVVPVLAPAIEIKFAPTTLVDPWSEKISPLPSIDRNPSLFIASANPYSTFPQEQPAAEGTVEVGWMYSFSSRRTLIALVLGIVLTSVLAVGILSYAYVHEGGELLIHLVEKIWIGYRPHPIVPAISSLTDSLPAITK